MDTEAEVPTRRSSRRANIVTEFEGLCLDWRIERVDSESVECELLTAANLTDEEYERAEYAAIEEWAND